MPTKAGIWIDHKQAIVVQITDAGQETQKIQSGIESSARSAGVRSKTKHTPNDFVAEDRQERKLTADRKKFFEEVFAGLHGATAVLILGPGEAKGEFDKHIKSKKLRGLTVELETTDKMTDRQLAAKVSEHFTNAPASRFAAPKKAATLIAGKRTKTIGKATIRSA